MRRSAGSIGIAVLRVVIVVVAFIAVIGWPLASFDVDSSTDTVTDPVSVSSFDANLTVAADGTLHAVETITASFPYGRHGIYQFFDVTAPWDSHARLIPQNISVTRDGAPDDIDLSWQNARHFRVVRIGNADAYVTPGTHVYVITYDIKGALAPAGFYWNVVGSGWQMPIAQANIAVTLPSAVSGDIKCAVGIGATSGCDADVSGKTVTVTAGPLAPRTPVTILAPLSGPFPGNVTLPWSAHWDGVLGTSLAALVVVVILTLLLMFLGYMWELRSREDPPGFPVQYDAPDKLGPVQAYYIANETLPAKALVATLLHEADRGTLKLDQREDKAWVITVQAKATEVDYVDPISAALVQALGITEVGHEFIADGSVAAGKSLKSLTAVMNRAASRWATSSGLMAPKGSEHAGKVLLVVSAILAVILFWAKPEHATLWTLPFVGFVVGGLGLIRPGVGTRRTAAGREQWAKAGGFYRLLSTPSAEDRFDFAAKKDLYISFIPYAVAFDCADEWAQKYKVNTGQEPPTPMWFGPMFIGSYGGWGSSSNPLSSFESSISSSISAYSASQRSSSGGGGGGFSGGGGGGGGGGGSW